MACQTHGNHEHKHGAQCGHQQIQHDDHTDYLHDGHLHHMHGEHVDEHSISNGTNKTQCTPTHKCDSHDSEHKHGAQCGHEAVPHEDHTDYMVEGHLHHPCGAHCDDHGAVSVK